MGDPGHGLLGEEFLILEGGVQMTRLLTIMTLLITLANPVSAAVSETTDAEPQNPFLGRLPALSRHYVETLRSLDERYKSFDYTDREQYAQAAKVAEEMEKIRNARKTEVARSVAQAQLVGKELPVTALPDRPYEATRAIIMHANDRQIHIEVTLRLTEDLSDAAPRGDWLERGFGSGNGRRNGPRDHLGFFFMAVDTEGRPVPSSGSRSGIDRDRSELVPGAEITVNIRWSFESLMLMQDFAAIEEITRSFYMGG